MISVGQVQGEADPVLHARFRRGAGGAGGFEPGNQDEQTDAHANRAVGDVEGGKADFHAVAGEEIKAQEINHLMADDSIHQIARDAAADQPQGNLAQEGLDVEVAAPEHQAEQGRGGNPFQDFVAVMEEAPGRAGVAPIDEAEKAVNDDPVLLGPEELEDEVLGGLIQRQNQGRNQ